MKKDTQEPQDYDVITEYEIREAISTIEFHELDKLRKGDIVFECFKLRTVITKVVSEPQKGKVESGNRVYDTWKWKAEIVEVYDYKWVNGKLSKVKVDASKTYQDYLISNVPYQGAPKLYAEDIYQYLTP